MKFNKIFCIRIPPKVAWPLSGLAKSRRIDHFIWTELKNYQISRQLHHVDCYGLNVNSECKITL